MCKITRISECYHCCTNLQELSRGPAPGGAGFVYFMTWELSARWPLKNYQQRIYCIKLNLQQNLQNPFLITKGKLRGKVYKDPMCIKLSSDWLADWLLFQTMVIIEIVKCPVRIKECSEFKDFDGIVKLLYVMYLPFFKCWRYSVPWEELGHRHAHISYWEHPIAQHSPLSLAVDNCRQLYKYFLNNHHKSPNGMARSCLIIALYDTWQLS